MSPWPETLEAGCSGTVVDCVLHVSKPDCNADRLSSNLAWIELPYDQSTSRLRQTRDVIFESILVSLPFALLN